MLSYKAYHAVGLVYNQSSQCKVYCIEFVFLDYDLISGVCIFLRLPYFSTKGMRPSCTFQSILPPLWDALRILMNLFQRY